MDLFARLEFVSLVFCDRIVRTSASKTAGLSPHPARLAEALTSAGRFRAPCIDSKICRARPHSDKAGRTKDGNGESVEYFCRDAAFRSRSVLGVAVVLVGVDILGLMSSPTAFKGVAGGEVRSIFRILGERGDVEVASRLTCETSLTASDKRVERRVAGDDVVADARCLLAIVARNMQG